jgi:phage terminase small subunit
MKTIRLGTGKGAIALRKTAFIEAFIQNGGNATQAAIQAGYGKNRARQTGARLVSDGDISLAIAERQQELAEKYALTTDDVIRTLAQALYFDPRRMFRPDGSLKTVAELDDDTAAGLSSFEVVEMAGGTEGDIPVFTKKVKWLDKNAAREQAMKHLGLFGADHFQRGPFADIPRPVVKMIVDRIRQLAIAH